MSSGSNQANLYNDFFIFAGKKNTGISEVFTSLALYIGHRNGIYQFSADPFTIAKVNPPERTHRKLLNHTSSFAPDQTTNSE